VAGEGRGECGLEINQSADRVAGAGRWLFLGWWVVVLFVVGRRW